MLPTLLPAIAPDTATDGLLQLVADALPVPLVITDLVREQVLTGNEAFHALWGSRPGSSLEHIRARMQHLAADPSWVSEAWSTLNRLDDGWPWQSFLLLRDGRQLRWNVRRLVEHGLHRAELHTFEWMTPEPVPRETLPSQNDLFRLTFEKAAAGITLISSDFRFLSANASFCRLLGYGEGQLLDRRFFDVLHPEDASRRLDLLEALATGQETFHYTLRFLTATGATVWSELSLSVVRDGDGRPLYFVALAEDITERKRLQEETEQRTRELQALASLDPLTGLYNHRFMQEALAQQLHEAARAGTQLSVLMMDIDSFREINETFGHDAGDRALTAVAECVSRSLRENDLACRYGGDELVAILVGASPEAALAAAARIRDRLEGIKPIAALEKPITVSIGVATYPTHASTVQSLLKAADMALYQAKRTGKDQACAYSPAPNQASSEEQLVVLQSSLQGASLEAVNALVTAIDLRDRYTGAHCQRVGRLAVELGTRLGCSEQELEILRLGAPLLDVGKIGLPDYLLTKSGALSRSEWDLMQQHPAWGEELVRRTALPEEVLQLVRWHHERLDGSGYPDGLAGEQIPLLVRIVNVADVATALREDRPHRRAWPRERVLEYLRRHAGEKLDERVIQAYGEIHGVR